MKTRLCPASYRNRRPGRSNSVLPRVLVCSCKSPAPAGARARGSGLLLVGLNHAGSHLFHAVCQGFAQLVLPKANHQSTLLLQRSGMSPVTHPVALQLLFPEGGIALRHVAAFSTAVPKATVNEYGQALPCEVKVGASSYVPRVQSPSVDTCTYQGEPEAALR